jgi:isocitrate dehydrogenase
MSERIQIDQGRLKIPDNPIIPFIEGDGIGVDITPAMLKVVDAVVKHAYAGKRKIEWKEVLAGEKAHKTCGEYLPQATLETLREHVVGIKGPLTTPVGGGIRSLNVTIRQVLDLYSCVRPVRWYGSASPLRHPEKLDVVVFRENTEDVYAGVEYESSSREAKQIISLLRKLGVTADRVAEDAAVGIKPISPGRTKRHVRKALRWALEKNRKTVTFMHKGNIMKFTEGAFLRWAYQVAEEPEFSGKLAINDRIADNMFQQLLTRTGEYDMIVAPNLNGDYISGDHLAVFEATHGSAPQYAGQDKVNPSSLILSAAMMLEYLGWQEAAAMIQRALETTLSRRMGTYDLVRGWRAEGEDRLVELKCSGFAEALVDNL